MIDSNLNWATYSNYGKNSVAIASPGSDILSTIPGNQYSYVSGSSIAVPFVSVEWYLY